jgi:hypothetical protein
MSGIIIDTICRSIISRKPQRVQAFSPVVMGMRVSRATLASASRLSGGIGSSNQNGLYGSSSCLVAPSEAMAA